MIEEHIDAIIDNTLNSFDFGLVIVINIATYIIIKIVDEFNGDNKVSVLVKRLILVGCVIIISIFYHYLDGSNDKLILNSAILAPVFWSWIGKPIVKKFNLDYKNGDGYGN